MKELDLIVKLLDEKKAENISVIDVSATNPLTTYFVIATVLSSTHAAALSDHIAKALKENNLPYNHFEGKGGVSKWILVDAYEVIVHLFTEEERGIYKLENMFKKDLFIDIQEILKNTKE
jgi:ribosome-associated protein